MSDYEDSDYEVNSGKRLGAEGYDCEDDEFDEDDVDDGDAVGVRAADGDDEDDEDEDEDENGDVNDINEDDADGDEKDKEDIIPSKRPKLDNTNTGFNTETNNSNKTTPGTYSNTLMPYGAKILGKFGHTHGKGLGKYEQGTVEPLEASDQKGKRGFGYRPKQTVQGREYSKEEKISLHEEVVWLENPYPDEICVREFNEFMVAKMGRPLTKMDEQTEFCNPEVLHKVLNTKSELDDIDNVSKVVARCNPFETIRNGIFLNRAAMKMANMDKVFDYMFTNPKDRNGVPITKYYDLLYFADVCAGPGGFSEYVFYRKKWRAKGFGFTLRRENDFKLDEFFAGPCETFEPHYGESIDGGPGDGDIFKSENIEEFSKFVMENTDNEGVHFMMADGGFGLNDRLMQEVESKQLYLCQCLVALKIVRTNGNFVVKLFDLFTPFSIGLVYLMYRSFDRISVHKPNSSRPANSERYLVCQYKRKGTDEIARYLSEINILLSKRSSTEDVMELVPISVLKEDLNFFEYIVESNTRIGERQVFHLKNIVLFAKADACDSRQDNFKEECLKYWDIPNIARTDPKKGEPNRKMEQLFRSDDGGIDSPVFLSEPAKEVDNLQKLTMVARKPLDWYWMVVESGKQTGTLKFYLGLGRTNVYSLEGKKWCKVSNKLSDFQLPDGTLIYGEIAEENVHNPNNLRGQYRVTAFHIVDGLFLGGEDIRYKHITERRRCCEMFAKSLSHSKIIYRVKKLYELNELSEVLSSSLQQRTLKNKKLAYGFDISNDRFIIPRGLLFFCGTKGSWCRNKSCKSNRFYFFNTSNQLSFWEDDLFPLEPSKTGDQSPQRRSMFTEFKECFVNRIVWWLDETCLAKWANKEE